MSTGGDGPVPPGDGERLAALERELQALRQYCQQSELSQEEVRRALQPLISAVNWAAALDRARSVVRSLATVIVLVAIAYLVCSSTPVKTAAYKYTRIALVKILPYWDWSSLAELDCLLENPMYENGETERTEDICQLCESLDVLERRSNVSVSEIADNYLRMDRPVIVTDATDDWPVFRETGFDRHRLIEVYKDSRLADALPCELSTNLKVHGEMRLLLNKMNNTNIKKWFAHWENCDKQAAKALRALYRRPYFLPAMVETSDSNWVLVSSNYTGSVYKMLPVVNDMVWMAQLAGTTRLRLTPRAPCAGLCPEIEDTLHIGEILMFTDLMWLLEYLPGHGTDNIAIGTCGFWE